MRFLSTLIASVLGTLVAFGVIVLFFIFFGLAFALSSDPTPVVPSGAVLIVEVDGPIPERTTDDPFARAFASTNVPRYDLPALKGALRKAAVDERIDGVWLRMQGTSASWATLEEVRTALLAFKESGKPLIASSQEYGLSEKGYFLASAADSAFAMPQAPFELNGFYISTAFFQNALQKLDIEPQIVRSGKFKSAIEPFIRENLSEANRMQLQAILDAQSSHFREAVAEGRAITAARVEELAQSSAILDADAAVQAGLLDGLRYEDELIDALQARFGYDADDDLPQVSVSEYARVPYSAVGLEATGEGQIGVVYAQGQIVNGESDNIFPVSGPGFIGSETFARAMEQARTNDNVKAVVLRIDSPGGAVTASEAMRREVALTAQQKPVIVSMGDVAASGGYYIATPADTIVADPLTLTGSIGVFSLFFDAGGLFENKLGITFDAVRTSPYADLFSSVRPLSDNERQLLKASVDDVYETFLQYVAESRGMTMEEAHEIAQGRVWAGVDAKRVGLVDVLGGLDEALRLAAERAGLGDGPYRTRTYPRPKTFFERLNESLYAQGARLWMQTTTSPAERALLEQRRTLQRLATQHGTVQARLPIDIHIE